MQVTTSKRITTITGKQARAIIEALQAGKSLRFEPIETLGEIQLEVSEVD